VTDSAGRVSEFEQLESVAGTNFTIFELARKAAGFWEQTEPRQCLTGKACAIQIGDRRMNPIA
jgi:carbamoylphosphate synthase large subunit